MLLKNHKLLHAEPGAGGGAVPGLPPGGVDSSPAPAPSSAPDPALGVPPDVSHETGGEQDPNPAPPPGLASPGYESAQATALPTDHPWIGQLPDDLKGSDSLKKFNTIDDLARSYINLETMNGTSLRIPGEDASEGDRKAFTEKLIKNVPELMYKPNMDTEESREEFFATVGRPSVASDYVDPEIEGAPADPADDSGMFKELDYEIGLTNVQYQQLVSTVMEANLTTAHEAEAGFAQEIQGLRSEWGYAYGDRYRAAMDIAARTGAPEQVQELFRDGTVNSGTIKWLYSLAKQFGGEGGELATQAGGANIDNAPDEANARIADIMGNKKHAYWDSGHPDNAKAIQDMVRLQKIANPKMRTDIDSLRGAGLPRFESQ